MRGNSAISLATGLVMAFSKSRAGVIARRSLPKQSHIYRGDCFAKPVLSEAEGTARSDIQGDTISDFENAIPGWWGKTCTYG
jgi:hypothetical protein